jgi:hypothetical protein
MKTNRSHDIFLFAFSSPVSFPFSLRHPLFLYAAAIRHLRLRFRHLFSTSPLLNAHDLVGTERTR